MSRFDYVKYDDLAIQQQDTVKVACKNLEALIGQIGQSLDPLAAKSIVGRSTALAHTKLEECYMWIGKAIRDEQIARNGKAELQEGRKNG